MSSHAHPARPVFALLAALSSTAGVSAQATRAVIDTWDGQPNLGVSYTCLISDDARVVAFDGDGTNLLFEDHNSTFDVFVRDLATGELERVSVSSAGAETDRPSYLHAISGDGRFVAFHSTGDALVPGDCCWTDDGFLHDRLTGTTTRITEDPLGVRLDSAWVMSLSGDGSLALITTTASNLGPPDTNGFVDVYLRDLASGTYTLVSVDSNGVQANANSGSAQLSRDGRFVAFQTSASNLVAIPTQPFEDVFVRDLVAGTTELVNVTPSGSASAAAAWGGPISAEGRYVAFASPSPDLVPGDTNGKIDVFVRDRWNATTRRASVAPNGAQADFNCFLDSLSADGRYAVFHSYATTLVPGDHPAYFDVFCADLLDGSLARISVASDGTAANGHSTQSSVSTGGLAAMVSEASNLVAGDAHANLEVFTHPPEKAIVSTYCTPKVNSQLCIAWIETSGWSSLSDPVPFLISTTQVINQKNGLLFYGLGAAALPFQGGTMCVAPPLRRLPVQSSGGSAVGTTDCSGSLVADFDAWIVSGVDPALVVGVHVYAQFYYRDPQDWAGHGSALSDGVDFEILP